MSGFERKRVSDLTGCAMVKKNYLDVLEKTLEHKVPQKDRRWQISEEYAVYEAEKEIYVNGWPIPLVSDLRDLTPET